MSGYVTIEDYAQGTPEIDVDEAMRRSMDLLKRNLEPFAVDGYAPEDMVQASLAISAKRIADLLEVTTFRASEQNTGLNSLCTILERWEKQHHLDAQSVTQALFAVEHTLRDNDGHNLRVTIARD